MLTNVVNMNENEELLVHSETIGQCCSSQLISWCLPGSFLIKSWLVLSRLISPQRIHPPAPANQTIQTGVNSIDVDIGLLTALSTSKISYLELKKEEEILYLQSTVNSEYRSKESAASELFVKIIFVYLEATLRGDNAGQQWDTVSLSQMKWKGGRRENVAECGSFSEQSENWETLKKLRKLQQHCSAVSYWLCSFYNAKHV